jgi:hypothetical protein
MARGIAPVPGLAGCLLFQKVKNGPLAGIVAENDDLAQLETGRRR